MTATCSTLFQTDVEPPSIEYRGVCFELSFKGKNVVGSIRIEQRNPMGRYNCRVDYTRRQHWTPAEHAAALRVVGHWFRDIGGIILLRGRQMGHIISRLKKGQSVEVTERCMHWAISAYAGAEWHRQNKAWTTLGRFFVGDHFDKWLCDSPAYQSHLDRQQAELADRRERDHRHRVERELADERALSRKQKQKHTVALMFPLRDIPDADLHALNAQVKQYEVQIFVHKDRRFRRMVASLDPRTRNAMLKIVRYETQNRWYHAPGEIGDMGPMSLDNDEYRFTVCHRLQHLIARHRGIDRQALQEELMDDAPPPPHAFSAWDIHVELERRRATGGPAGDGEDRLAAVRLHLRDRVRRVSRSGSETASDSLPIADCRGLAQTT